MPKVLRRGGLHQRIREGAGADAAGVIATDPKKG